MSFIWGFTVFEFWDLVFSAGTFVFVMLIYFIMRRSWLDRAARDDFRINKI